ncbi:MAG: glycosyltransferase family 4 protein, partial [Actinomycetota bacterium]|nr:glycosyltransferase family 4 protein [Actinomycetota bacterium]
MRVVFVAWRDLANPLAGGSEILVDRLARGLMDRGHHVDLLCGAPADPRPYPVTITGGTYLQFLGAPLRYLRSHQRTDLVVEVANGMPFFSPLWRRGPTLCLVNHVHLDMWRMWFPPVLAALGRVVEGRALPAVHRHRPFVAVSPSTAEGLMALGVAPERIRVVHNGVDLPSDPSPKSSEPLFLAMGRLVPHKRFDLLLRLWEQVRPVTGGRLIVAGEGPDHKRL